MIASMIERSTNFDLAIKYNDALPPRIRTYLSARGIPEPMIDLHLLGWNGWRITIPIPNRDGDISSFRLAKDPDDARPDPKMLSQLGAKAELYGWESILKKPSEIVICEGEFDRLVLEANGFPAVTSTAGAAGFRPEWAAEFGDIPNVYVCFDRDNAGRAGAAMVAGLIPCAELVELPEEVGTGGDVTDFFARLGRTAEEFSELLAAAKPASVSAKPAVRSGAPRGPQRVRSARVQSVKERVQIARVIGQYVTLRQSWDRFTGRCPFHEDHSPSFVVYPATGTYHCFGCGAHGDVISFIRNVEHLGFLDALAALEAFKPHEQSAA